MKSAVVIIVLFVAFLAVAVDAKKFLGGRFVEEYCYSDDTERPQYLRMNTKTAYQLAKGGERIVFPAGCIPTKFWLLNRHGTRLPNANKIEKYETLPTYQAEIIANYANGKQPSVGALCEADLKLLRDWRWDSNITTDKAEYLTLQGWNDLKGIAQYYKTQFPTLLGAAYSAEKFYFRHTDTQRTQASFKAFVDGLWGDGAYKNIPSAAIPSVDTLLRPHDHCSKWADQEAALEKSSSELSKFEESTTYLQMVADVSTKAGYSSALKANRIKWMFEMCFYDVAWELGKNSPWCSLFTLAQAKIFEYTKDIEEWNLGGSATTLNTRLSCEVMQDMLTKLNTLDGPTAIAYFAHSTTLQLFLTGLGYAVQDIPLLASNYEANVNRKFVTSKICALASNVAVVRYDCDTGVKVQFLMNERPMQLDWCTNGLCDWEVVKTKLSSIAAQNCSSYFCSN